MPKPQVGERRTLDDGDYVVVEVGPLMVYEDVAAKGKRPRFESVLAGYWTRCERVYDPQRTVRADLGTDRSPL